MPNHLRDIHGGSFMLDLDIVEMFPNFILHTDMSKYCVVDL